MDALLRKTIDGWHGEDPEKVIAQVSAHIKETGGTALTNPLLHKWIHFHQLEIVEWGDCQWEEKRACCP